MEFNMNITEIPIEPGTKFGVKFDPNTIYIINKSQHICIFRNMEISDPIDITLPFLQRNDFEIVPDKPKVLNPEKYASKMFSQYMETTSSRLNWFKEIARRMHENGRLERYLETRSHLEEFERILISIRSSRKGSLGAIENVYCDIKLEVKMIDDMYKDLKNLKPLNANGSKPEKT